MLLSFMSLGGISLKTQSLELLSVVWGRYDRAQREPQSLTAASAVCIIAHVLESGDLQGVVAANHRVKVALERSR